MPVSAATGGSDAPPPGEGADARGGQGLTATQRGFFEPRFGVDLGHVRIHAGADAARDARRVRANAYTQGADIVFGRDRYAPGTPRGDRLIAHELAHVVQQTAPAGVAGPVARRTSGHVLARSVDDWLSGSVDVRGWTYTQLIDEIDELDQYLQRQTSSSPESGLIEDALVRLRAQVRLQEANTAAPAPRRGRGRRRRQAPPAAETGATPMRMPRVLQETTSVAYDDPAQMREEFDLVMQWLARRDITAAQREILEAERANLAPQFTVERQRVAGARHAERVRSALTPDQTSEADQLETLTRTILGIAAEPGNPAVAYIYHRGERIAISAAQADELRTTLHNQLRRAAGRIQSRLEAAWAAYEHQVAVNDDFPVISSIAGFLGDVDDPGMALFISYRTCSTRVRRMKRLIDAGELVQAVRLLPRAERIALEVEDMSDRFHEGHMAGAQMAVSGLEFTRDASFAIAAGIAAVVAAPVVAGAVGVGGLGFTGATATALTMVGTGTVVGTGLATARGGSAAVGTLAAGGSLAEAGAALTAEGWRGFREGFLTGAGGAAARSVGLVLNVGGSVSRQVAIRVGSEAIINGTTTMIDVLARGGTVEQAAQAAAISAVQSVPGALLGGSNNPVVRNMVAPFTASAMAYLAARASGESSDVALAHAGVALASNVAMTRAARSPDADAAAVARGQRIGTRVRGTAASAARTVRSGVAATMIGVADAVPPVRSGFGGSPVVLEPLGTPAVSVPRRAVDTSTTASAGAVATPQRATATAPTVADADAPAASATTARAQVDGETATPAPVHVEDDLNIDAAIAPGAPADVGTVRTIGRTEASGRSRDFASLDRAALSPTQRVSAIRLVGQRFNTALRQAWNATRNARETAEMATIAAHWNAGRHEQARELARAAFNRHRGRFWARVRADPALRALFTDAGMVFQPGRGAPVYVDPTTGEALDLMSIEHQTRLADDPTRALDAGNLQSVLGDENSVHLEGIRRDDPFQ
jgi:hypothetical protein